jgi:pyridoxamine 5'-phosphate oxidase
MLNFVNNLNVIRMNINIADLRKDYTLKGLSESEVDPNPFVQFRKWFDQALGAKLTEPNAMTLATTTIDGKPSARIVLLKDFDERGFVFYTNYSSRKGRESMANPHAALIFWWAELERQVRICGRIEKISASESDEYFHSRPRQSRLGAWASHQSEVIDNRAVLEERFANLQSQYEHQDIPRPHDWGGLRIIPIEIEFWQGRSSRLHDRLLYNYLENGDWRIKRLSP